MLSDPLVSKETIAMVENCNKWIFREESVGSPLQVCFEGFWISYRQIMVICRDV